MNTIANAGAFGSTESTKNTAAAILTATPISIGTGANIAIDIDARQAEQIFNRVKQNNNTQLSADDIITSMGAIGIYDPEQLENEQSTFESLFYRPGTITSIASQPPVQKQLEQQVASRPKNLSITPNNIVIQPEISIADGLKAAIEGINAGLQVDDNGVVVVNRFNAVVRKPHPDVQAIEDRIIPIFGGGIPQALLVLMRNVVLQPTVADLNEDVTANGDIDIPHIEENNAVDEEEDVVQRIYEPYNKFQLPTEEEVFDFLPQLEDVNMDEVMKAYAQQPTTLERET